MADNTIRGTADDLAEGVASAGQAASDNSRKAGDAVRSASRRGAADIRRAGRRGEDAFDDVSRAFDSRATSLEDGIRQNPLAAAGAALLVGIVIGRLFL